MLLYISYVIIALIFWFSLNNSGKENSLSAKKAMYFLGAILVTIAACRSYKMCTVDIGVYISDYEQLMYKSFSDYLQWGDESQGAYALSWLFYHLTGWSVQFWFAAVALFYTFSLCYFFRKYSKDYVFCVILFFAIGLFSFSLNGIKQTVSMSFAILAWVKTDQRKYVWAVILYILAFWCHAASSVFLLSFALYFLRETKIYYRLLIVFSIAVAFFGPILWSEGIGLLNNEHYESYTNESLGYTATTLIFYIVLLGSAIYYYKLYSSENNNESRIMYGNAIMAAVLNSLCVVFSTAFRLSYYFLPFMIVLLSNCSYQNKKSNMLFKALMLAMILFFFFYTGRDRVYIPFWE